MELCNRIVWPRKCYSGKKVNSIKRMIQVVRESLIKEFGGRNDRYQLFAGIRFNDNDSVIARLESTLQDKIKQVGWKYAIRSALIDCMESDYYYTFEKEY